MFLIDINHKDIGLKSYKIRTKKEALEEGIKYKYWKDKSFNSNGV